MWSSSLLILQPILLQYVLALFYGNRLDIVSVAQTRRWSIKVLCVCPACILVGIEAGADDGFGHADGAVVLLGVHAVVPHVGVIIVSIGRNQHWTSRADETRPTVVVLPPTVPFEVVVVVVVCCPMAGRLSVARRSCSITTMANCEKVRTWTTTQD